MANLVPDNAPTDKEGQVASMFVNVVPAAVFIRGKETREVQF